MDSRNVYINIQDPPEKHLEVVFFFFSHLSFQKMANVKGAPAAETNKAMGSHAELTG